MTTLHHRLPGWNTFTAQAGLLVFVLVGSALLALSTFWHWRLEMSMRNQIVEETNGITSELDEAMARYGPAYSASLVSTLEDTPQENHLLLVWDDHGKIVGDLNHWPVKITTTPKWTTWEMNTRMTAHPMPLIGRVKQYPTGQKVIVAYETTRLVKLREQLWHTIGEALVLSAALSALVASVLGWWLNKRLLKLNHVLEAITEGDLSRRLPAEKSTDGLGRLSLTINRTLEWLGSLLTLTQHSQTALAHDLRTPLSRLRATLEELVAETPKSRTPRITQAIAEVDGLLGYAHRLLTLARIHSGSPRLEFKSLDITTLLQDIGEAYQPVAEESGQSLTLDIPDGITFKGDAQLLSQALFNLMENARKYGKPGQTITLGLHAKKRLVDITVTDEGSGFDIHNPNAIQGYGLGLQLVEAIAKLHHGELVLQQNPANPGFKATLKMPQKT